MSFHRSISLSAFVLLAASAAPLSAQFAMGGPERPEAPITESSSAKRPVPAAGQVIIPTSSLQLAADKGKKAHTNVRFILPSVAIPFAGPPATGYAVETPQSVACIYGVVTAVSGCNPNNASLGTPSSGSQTIAIVDAYDDPNIYGDLAYFSDQFGIPLATSQFEVVYGTYDGSVPPADFTGGWELEESLDVEYAHALAPKAKLYLVEAASNQYTDLLTAVQVAINLVRCGSKSTSSTACASTATGKGEVSMSWGGEEFSGETSTGYDSAFAGANVVFLASTGDTPGTEWPSVSPNVVAVGGTSTVHNLTNGNFTEEIAWSDAGSGPSSYEPIPSFQSSISSIAGKVRVVPDVSAVANPATGVWVYDSYALDLTDFGLAEDSGAWFIVGGTSVAAPVWTAVVNNAATKSGTFAANTAAEEKTLYTTLGNKTNYAADFNDITYGACYFYSGYFSGTGYDLCTGIGSPKGLAGK